MIDAQARRSRPKVLMESVTFRTEPALKRFVERAAKAQGLTVSTWLRSLVLKAAVGKEQSKCPT